MTAALGADGGLAGLVAWIEAETGLCFPEVHHETIRKEAARRCAELGLEPASYEAVLGADHVERTRFLDRILIGETYFFRDERQFRILVSTILPGMLRACRDERRELLLWSATCATGEEALSLAASVEEARAAAQVDVAYRVMATDLNARALEGLASGRFPLSSFRADGKGCHPLLDRCGRREGDSWVAEPAVLGRIEGRHLNILSGKAFGPRSFDLVMFRNTLLYMRQARKEKAISRVVEAIKPGGFLFLASPEVPTVRHPLLDTLETDGVFYFARRDTPAASETPAAPRRPAASKSPAAPRSPALGSPRASLPVGRHSSHVTPRLPSRQPVTRIGATDLAKGLALASRWLLDPAARDESLALPGELEAALLIESTVSAIHARDADRADGLVDRLESLAGENHLSQYLRGLSARLHGRDQEAIELWERSRTYESGFWPALFQAGSALEPADPERGRPLLIACVEAIRSESDPNAFAAILDGFNSSYYRRMAERLLARSRGR